MEKPNRTIVKPFGEVSPGQKFWTKNDDQIECHVRLYEEVDSYNACEINTGCLCQVADSFKCEVEADNQGPLQNFRFYLVHSGGSIIIAVEGSASFDANETEIKRRLGEAIKNWDKHNPGENCVNLFDIDNEIEGEFADTFSQVYTDPETLECHIQRQGIMSLALEAYHIAESDWYGDDNLID